jgi:hypothetical protein
MKTADLTLKERAAHLYRRLSLLQRLFQTSQETEDVEWLGTGDKSRDSALCAGIGELLDELMEHVKILAAIPFPLSEWRPGDGPDDERWRALTEIERREILAMVSGYERLISWGEDISHSAADVAGQAGRSGAGPALLSAGTSRELGDTVDDLKAARAHVERFRQDMRFLERRRVTG